MMQIPSPIYMFLIVIAAIILIFTQFTIMTDFKSISIYPTLEAETALYHNSFIYNPQCFAHQDFLTGRVYNEIDASKFTNTHFEECYLETDRIIRLTLTYENTIKTLGNPGGNLKARKVSSSVIVRDNGIRKLGSLTTEVWFGKRQAGWFES